MAVVLIDVIVVSPCDSFPPPMLLGATPVAGKARPSFCTYGCVGVCLIALCDVPRTQVVRSHPWSIQTCAAMSPVLPGRQGPTLSRPHVRSDVLFWGSCGGGNRVPVGSVSLFRNGHWGPHVIVLVLCVSDWV